MTNITYAQLEQLWINAGGSQTLAPVMAAVAEAESGGDPNATNPTDNGGKQTSWGLWQISNGTHTAPSPNWNNPAVNAQLAVAKYNSQGLGAWGTYTSGAYKAFLSTSTTPSGAGLAAASAGANAATAGSQAASAQAEANCAWRINFNIPLIGGDVCILSWSQIRAMASIGFLAAGGLLGVFGVASLMATTGAGGAAARTAGSAAEIGGGAAALLGAPEVGAPVAAAGAAAKRGGHARRAGQYAQRKRTEKRTAARKQASEESAQERHTASQYRRQRRARENYQRDQEKVPF